MANEDTHQDIARSSYADMLNDDERNRAYNDAIKLCTRILVRSKHFNPDGNKFFQCCDIGTGSGLLSMMIVDAFKGLQYGNFHVTSFEAFAPMAQCAQKVVQANGMTSHITVISGRSDQGSKTYPKFDLLVAELLDTELIGEGCLEVYRHAVADLCSPECIFVPTRGRIFAEPVSSRFLYHRHMINDLKIELKNGQEALIAVPDEVKNCCGMPEIDDLQVSMLREIDDFIRVTKPQLVFEFDFSNLALLPLRDSVELIFPVNEAIQDPIVVVTWWDIDMYDRTLLAQLEKPISLTEPHIEVLSCAPTWARSKQLIERDTLIRQIYGRQVWREHWIQGVYHLPRDLSVEEISIRRGKASSSLSIYAYHDSHSMWFSLRPCSTRLPPSCTCGVHRVLNRSDLIYLSSEYHIPKLMRALLQDCDEFVQGEIDFARNSSLDRPKWRITCADRAIEDFSFSSELPWCKIMSMLRHSIDLKPVDEFSIKFTQVEFENLNRIDTDIVACEGFNLMHLDELINDSSRLIDQDLESHYLWEYETRCIDVNDYVLFNSKSSQAQDHFRLPIGAKTDLKRWALVFWLELKLTDGSVLSMGPQIGRQIEQQIVWDKYCKQLVHFLHRYPITPHRDSELSLRISLTQDSRPIVTSIANRKSIY